MGAIILLVAPLVHMALPKSNANVDLYEAQLEQHLKPLELQLERLTQEYATSDRPAKEYIAKYDQVASTIKSIKSKNDKLITLKTDASRYWGWKTKRTFWIGFGVRLPLLIMAIIISILIANRQSTEKNRDKALFILQTACYAIALYEVVWCFWYAQDYPLSTYWYALLIFTLLAGAFITYQFRYYRSVMGLLHKVKADFIDFLVEFRNSYYQPLLVRILKTSNYRDEKSQQELKEDTQKLENRLHEKAIELID